MFKRLTKKLLNILFQKSLPVPSKLELENLSEFRRAFSNLPTMEIKNLQASEIAWIKNMNRLKDLAMHQNPRKFFTMGCHRQYNVHCRRKVYVKRIKISQIS